MIIKLIEILMMGYFGFCKAASDFVLKNYYVLKHVPLCVRAWVARYKELSVPFLNNKSSSFGQTVTSMRTVFGTFFIFLMPGNFLPTVLAVSCSSTNAPPHRGAIASVGTKFSFGTYRSVDNLFARFANDFNCFHEE